MKEKPPFLYRAYKNAQQAKQVIESGKVRLGFMIGYRRIEDRRRKDKEEGVSDWYVENVPGHRGHVIGQHINPLYLLCTSGPDVGLAYLRSKYGKWIVKINNPSRLLEDLNNYRPKPYRMKVIGKCKLEQVSYTKGEILKNIDPNTFEATRLVYTQKHIHNLSDQEYRYIVQTEPVVGTNPSAFLYYNFGRPIEYIEIV
jgi:hypothetical protein